MIDTTGAVICPCRGTVHDADCRARRRSSRPVVASGLSANIVQMNQVSTTEVWVSSDEED